MSQLVNAAALAAVLGVSPSSVREWTRRRLIPHTRLPSTKGNGQGDARYDVEEVRASLPKIQPAEPQPRSTSVSSKRVAGPTWDLPPADLEAFRG